MTEKDNKDNNTQSFEFLRSVLDSLGEHIVIIDAQGEIQWVNFAWTQFAIENCCEKITDWRGRKYLDAFRMSGIIDSKDVSRVSRGLQGVVRKGKSVFYHEYACDCANGKRWFMMQVNILDWTGPKHYVVSHLNITPRKIAEEEVHQLSLRDSLTSIANRRHFDIFLENEWRRSVRLNVPISLILFDIDCFKSYNDNYGHPAGDNCLRLIGRTICRFGNRPGDLVTRYGGEEFAVILASTNIEHAALIAENIRISIYDLKIKHEYSVVSDRITISAGVASIIPSNNKSLKDFIEATDKALYAAKSKGRNQISAKDLLCQKKKPARKRSVAARNNPVSPAT